MAAPRSGSAGVSLAGNIRASTLCARCRQSRTTLRTLLLLARPYSSPASAPTELPTPPLATPAPPDPFAPPPADPSPTGRFPVHPPLPHRLCAGIILTRPPLLTRQPTPFEEAFFFYQKRLNERLTMKFVEDVYFRKRTPARMDWVLKMRDRRGVLARELGGYRGIGGGTWDDELLVGDEASHTGRIAAVLAEDAVMRISEDAEVIPAAERAAPEMPLPRETDADRRGDATRLDRKLDRTLYFMVKDRDGRWAFPSAALTTDESLHETAQRVLNTAAGPNMNTWLVGRTPVSHTVTKPTFGDDGVSLLAPGIKTFFLKARIMAGQANLRGNPFGFAEFKWLTREEVEELVEQAYFKALRGMMPAR